MLDFLIHAILVVLLVYGILCTVEVGSRIKRDFAWRKEAKRYQSIQSGTGCCEPTTKR